MIELRDIQKTFDGHVVLRDYSYQTVPIEPAICPSA